MSRSEDTPSLPPDEVMQPDALHPGHSDIFERLHAHEEAGLIGIVAYGLYQRRKRAWMAAFKQRCGHFPSQAERDEYAFGYREDAISALRSEAETAMAAFAESMIEQQIDQLRADALNAQLQAVLTAIDGRLDHLGGYRHHIVGHLAGFAILVGIVAIIALAVVFEPSLERVFNWMVEHLR